jgi:hypothetical protein
VNDWDRDDVERQLQLLTIDVDKKNELVIMYHERNKEMEVIHVNPLSSPIHC